MKGLQVYICVLLIGGLCVSAGSAACAQNNSSCKWSGECCGGCCDGSRCITSAPTNCYPQQSPCATANCAPGQTCELTQVQCIRAPCPPQAQCSGFLLNRSGVIRFMVYYNSGFTSAADSEKCYPQTNPCAFTLCRANTTCVLVDVLCKKEPCPPQAECSEVIIHPGDGAPKL